MNLKTRAGMLATASVLSLACMQMASANHVAPGPGVVCYDFSNADQSIVYGTNDSVVTPFATIEINNLRTLDGTQLSNPAQNASIATSVLAGSTTPEYLGYFVNARILPNTPVTSVSMHVAQNTGGNNAYLYTNLAINGEVVQLANGLGSANGLVLGNDAEGQVLVTSTQVIPVPAPAQWINGTLELTALTGSINRFSLGSPRMAIDDVCMTQ